MEIILKIKDKLILITVLTILIAISLSTFFNLKDFIVVYRKVMMERVFAQSAELRNMIREVTSLGLDLGELTGLEKECKEVVRTIPYAKFCYVMDMEGKILYHNNKNEMGLIYADLYTEKALRSKKRMIQYIRLNNRVKLYDFSLPIRGTNNEQIGVLRVGIHSTIVDKQIFRLIMRSILFATIAMAIAWSSIYFLTKINIFEPLDNLMQGITRFSKGDLKYRIYMQTKDELNELSLAFNKMAKDLQNLMQKEKDLTQLAEARAKAEQDKALELASAYKKLEEVQDSLIQIEKFNAIGKLANGIAHEVKNPLGAILASVEYIEVTTPKEDVQKLDIIEGIKDNIKRASSIIDDLSALSRTSRLTKVYYDINKVIHKAIHLVYHQCSDNDVRIIAELDESVPELLIDEEKMEQVFINLFLNAIQAMPQGGTLTVSTYSAKMTHALKMQSVVESESINVGDDVFFAEVKDTGEGINGWDLQHIFEPFFTTKPAGQGTGLGLSISSNIVMMHDGEISIISEKLKGTKITIILKLN